MKRHTVFLIVDAGIVILCCSKSKNDNRAQGYDAAKVVFGETPYAAGAGDVADLSISSPDYQTPVNGKSAIITTAVVLDSGRSIIISNILDKSDAIIAAWLPGSEGEGISDVLFGDYKPVGKQTYSLLRDMSRVPINYGDQNYEPLFFYKYALTY